MSTGFGRVWNHHGNKSAATAFDPESAAAKPTRIRKRFTLPTHNCNSERYVLAGTYGNERRPVPFQTHPCSKCRSEAPLTSS
jgi:hypothetical protein